jgi:hypothetical protein
MNDFLIDAVKRWLSPGKTVAPIIPRESGLRPAAASPVSAALHLGSRLLFNTLSSLAAPLPQRLFQWN